MTTAVMWRGSGFYVTAPLDALVLDRLEKTVEREVDRVWMLRLSLGSAHYAF